MKSNPSSNFSCMLWKHTQRALFGGPILSRGVSSGSRILFLFLCIFFQINLLFPNHCLYCFVYTNTFCLAFCFSILFLEYTTCLHWYCISADWTVKWITNSEIKEGQINLELFILYLKCQIFVNVFVMCECPQSGLFPEQPSLPYYIIQSSLKINQSFRDSDLKISNSVEFLQWYQYKPQGKLTGSILKWFLGLNKELTPPT